MPPCVHSLCEDTTMSAFEQLVRHIPKGQPSHREEPKGTGPFDDDTLGAAQTASSPAKRARADEASTAASKRCVGVGGRGWVGGFGCVGVGVGVCSYSR